MHGKWPYICDMPTEAKTSRFEARISPDVHAMIKRAADLEGRSMTDYVMATAVSAARDTIERSETLKLNRESAEAFVEIMMSPPPIAPAMKRAAEHRERLFGSK